MLRSEGLRDRVVTSTGKITAEVKVMESAIDSYLYGLIEIEVAHALKEHTHTHTVILPIEEVYCLRKPTLRFLPMLLCN